MVEIRKPTLIIDSERCKANIFRATEKARREKIILRPHFKTHQSAAVGNWFRDAGVECISVSSVAMAQYFAGAGWKDITIAIPVNVTEAEDIERLAAGVDLTVFVADGESLTELADHISSPLQILIEIDTGQHRSGIDPGDFMRIEKILDLVVTHPQFHFKGFATHAGHSYNTSGDVSLIRQIHRESIGLLAALGDKYRERYPELILSAGDTPTFSLAENFTPLDEVRPGNFVFYDLFQQNLGTCSADQIAVALFVPVISINSNRKELVIYGGAVHLSKDVFFLQDGAPCYGKVVRIEKGKWDPADTGMYVSSVSQEHGVITLGENDPSSFKPGDILGILPVHSCLSCDLATSYFTTDGNELAKMN